MARRRPRQRSGRASAGRGLAAPCCCCCDRLRRQRSPISISRRLRGRYSTPQSLCPVNGPQGITVVLVDTSDDLPETTRREVLGQLDDMITTLAAVLQARHSRSRYRAGAQPLAVLEMQSGRRRGLERVDRQSAHRALAMDRGFSQACRRGGENQCRIRQGQQLADHGRHPGHRHRRVFQRGEPGRQENALHHFRYDRIHKGLQPISRARAIFRFSATSSLRPI